MPSVRVRDNEPFDVALRRFKRACEKAGVLSEVHRREFYEKPTQIRKRKAAAAQRLRHEIDGPDQLSVLAAQADDGESQEGNDRAKPADRGNHMSGQRELALAR